MKLEASLVYWAALAAVGLVLVAGGIYFLWVRKRPSADELERRRREMIDRVGKMGDGTITEVHDSLVSYTYHVRGIEYQATQDIAGMDVDLQPEQWGTIHAVSVKFDPRNPANSLIISRKWNGLPKNLIARESTKVNQ